MKTVCERISIGLWYFEFVEDISQVDVIDYFGLVVQVHPLELLQYF